MIKLIIGLGNPGAKYEKTRHNVGFMIVDELQKSDAGFSNWKEDKKNKSLISKSSKLILAKPQTFMNNSGQAVQSLMSYYNIDLENILVIHDDVDILLGKIKIQKGRSAAGHKGVQSIIDQINSKDFTRLRIGVARKSRTKMGDTARFVLRKFTILERKKIKKIIDDSITEVTKQFF